MSGINIPLQEIITKLKEVTDFQLCVTFNNQFEYMAANQIEAIPFPAAFVEIVGSEDRAQLLNQMIDGDVIFRVHIAHQEFDAQDGTLEENKNVFALKDKVVKKLVGYKPTGCSHLMLKGEKPDYEHSNLYHYILDFICSFIDDTADSRQNNIIKPANTTTLVINATLRSVYIK